MTHIQDDLPTPEYTGYVDIECLLQSKTRTASLREVICVANKMSIERPQSIMLSVFDKYIKANKVAATIFKNTTAK